MYKSGTKSYETCYSCAVIRIRSVYPISATDLKDLIVISLFDFLEWNEAQIVATIRRRLEVNKTFLLEYNLAGILQSALAQEVFVQGNAGFYEAQRAFHWYGEKRK